MNEEFQDITLIDQKQKFMDLFYELHIVEKDEERPKSKWLKIRILIINFVIHFTNLTKIILKTRQNEA